MTTHLNILFVEDSPDDAQLIMLHLEQGGFEVQYRRVDTEAAFQAALDSPPDLILSDFAMPQFNGLRALRIVRERRLDIPFLLVSGTIGEEVAVDAMKQGADDYLLKDRLGRLVPAIQNALNQKLLRDEKERTDAALRNSEARYRNIFQTVPVSIWEMDFSEVHAALEKLRIQGITDFRAYLNDHPEFVQHTLEMVSVLDVNKITLHLYNAEDKTELLGGLKKFVTPEDFGEELIAFAEGKTYFEQETTGYTADGKLLHFWMTQAFFMDESGRYKALVSLNDISERKRAEEQIQRQIERLNALRMIDIALISSFDLQVILDVVLQQILSQLGADASAVLLLNPHLQAMEHAASRGFRSNAIQHTQLKSSQGHAGRAVTERRIVHVMDVKRTSGELAKAPHLAGEDFVDYYGIPLIVKGEVKGVLEIYHRAPLNLGPEQLDFLETLSGQAAIAIDNSQLFQNLQRANLELEQRVAERTAELNQTNLELGHANRAKDEFLATMSHELRTPLNSILGLSESLLEQQRGSLNKEQQNYLQTIESSGRHLLELINDVLDLSKIEAGKFDYYPQVIEVNALCQSSLAFIRQQAMRKSIALRYEEDRAVAQIHADPRRLKQVLVNLLTNAVKFTPENGQVTLRVRSDPERELIQFSVIDTGIGIARADLKKLFQPFSQVDSSLTREFEGTGLGLALVQKLADLHGGSVEVESEPGKGSRFTVNLPWRKDSVERPETGTLNGEPFAATMEKKTTKAAQKAAVARKVVLLAEDHMTNILMVSEYLENHGYQVVVARDGWEAIAKAEETDPHLILMDIQLPSLDGLEAIRRLRAYPRFASTPIIALTALAMPGDRERCLEAGANEYMSKPVSLKGLIKTIGDFLGRAKE